MLTPYSPPTPLSLSLGSELYANLRRLYGENRGYAPCLVASSYSKHRKCPRRCNRNIDVNMDFDIKSICHRRGHPRS